MQKVKINMHYLKGERDILHTPFNISKSCPAWNISPKYSLQNYNLKLIITNKRQHNYRLVGTIGVMLCFVFVIQETTPR